MWTFLILFLTVYTTMHAVFHYRVRVLFGDRNLLLGLWLAFLGLMVLAPVVCRVLERLGHDLAARTLAYVGYTWMGFVFLGFWAAIAVGIVNGGAWTLNRLLGVHLNALPGRGAALAVIAVAGALTAYGALEAGRIRIERIQVPTDKLPPGHHRLVVAQISDVHLGLVGREARLRKILEAARSVSPDLLVSTGDLVDGATHSLEHLLPLFQSFQPPLGKVAIVGNHEYYAGIEAAVDLTRRAGFTVLRDQAVTVGSLLNVVGSDDTWRNRPERETQLLRSVPQSLFTLYLKHRPQVCPETVGLFDLQLSGHTHRGQIFPFTLFVALMYRYQNGTYDLGGGSLLHTNRGTGTWGPPIRVLAPPELTVIEIVRK
ncbi:hypothetical protein SAMN02746041_00969 [Desulfacinum hydrothermale DSM 13146]|uniref:Calcineurin-like phosphoesterase domain-containing protein n=1 Tax=Desulfacinum hydrothermale DSM 13146 TaxID=1121390 RepID=A0A1W1X9W9_9BACT|nr:metallophosphoesterase [Desulfacinum hydrothermale]SMC20614.1 hypothetical protein SAMN02746041_00969 [Desulfacinum hydrothermale DSM 13146]